MLTRNFYVAMLAQTVLNGTGSTSMSYRLGDGSYYPATRSVSEYDGRYRQEFTLHPNIIAAPSGATYSNACLTLGSDMTPATLNDYKVNTPVSFSYTKGTVSTPTYNEQTKTYSLTQRYVLTNNTSSDISVGEYGIYNCLGSTKASGQSNVLVFREALSEPFVVASGESVNFDLTYEYQMPVEYEPYVPV